MSWSKTFAEYGLFYGRKSSNSFAVDRRPGVLSVGMVERPLEIVSCPNYDLASV